jgi:flagellar biosynthesis protein FliQ
MPAEFPSTLVREGFSLLVVTGGPVFLGLLLMGLAIGMFQAATQINDPAFSFLPRIMTLMAILWAMGTYIVEQYSIFFARAVQHMSGGNFGG